MSIKTIPIQTDFFTTFLFLDISQKTVFGSADQKTNSAGIPLWSVAILATHDEGFETLSATMAGDLATVSAVFSDLSPGDPVMLKALSVGAFVKGKYADFYWTVEEVKSFES